MKKIFQRAAIAAGGGNIDGFNEKNLNPSKDRLKGQIIIYVFSTLFNRLKIYKFHLFRIKTQKIYLKLRHGPFLKFI